MRLILATLVILLVGGGCMLKGSDKEKPDLISIVRTENSWGVLRPLAIAHRCGAGLGPENTCGAVVQSSFYRPDYYEIDIRHTADGVAICMHDETLDRTTNLSGAVSGTMWARIQDADAGSWFEETFQDETVPDLARMLDCVNPAALLIELKEADITLERCRSIAALLFEANDKTSLVLSFHRGALETYREADPERRTGFLATELNDYALEGPHDLVGLAFASCTPELVRQIHDAGKAVFVYTVNNEFERLIRMGVDGIITDYPNRLREALPPS